MCQAATNVPSNKVDMNVRALPATKLHTRIKPWTHSTGVSSHACMAMPVRDDNSFNSLLHFLSGRSKSSV